MRGVFFALNQYHKVLGLSGKNAGSPGFCPKLRARASLPQPHPVSLMSDLFSRASVGKWCSEKGSVSCTEELGVPFSVRIGCEFLQMIVKEWRQQELQPGNHLLAEGWSPGDRLTFIPGYSLQTLVLPVAAHTAAHNRARRCTNLLLSLGQHPSVHSLDVYSNPTYQGWLLAEV